MEQTKFENGNLRIVMNETIRAQIDNQVMVDEIYRLIESFGNKLLMEKATGEIDFTNKTTGANMILDIQWESENSAVVNIKEVNLTRKKVATA